MAALQESISEYKNQLEKGEIQKAYKGILEYLMSLRTHFEKQYPDWTVPGGLYTGYMDMSYFSIIPPSLKERKLKIAVVFIHDACRFEVWLAGVNKGVQAEYWQMIKESGWDLYEPVATTQGADAIIEHILILDPDFDDLDGLTRQIQNGVQVFSANIDNFFVNHN
ncbi:MAG: DUF7000 family protein [Anaerolineaceae bacterium]